jgi:hypothetical protein
MNKYLEIYALRRGAADKFCVCRQGHRAEAVTRPEDD